jgi:hypothetical protein
MPVALLGCGHGEISMSEHEEYPMTMAHPSFKASQSLPIPGTEKRNAQGHPIPGSCDYQGTPERLPPVTVTTPDEREYYEAQGYKPAGYSDPAAYATAHSSAAPETYVPQEYPKYVDGVLCEDEDAELALLGLVEEGPAKNRGGRPRKIAA